ncbi:MAG: hypothetical protein EOO46_03815 [Flavobacterium sp.]|nr:MAG: hypothetical protein EOO46_03815 [Flavobacterium sp.]
MYNDIRIEVKHNKELIFHNNIEYTGYLKIRLEDDSFCYEFIRDGNIMTHNCHVVKQGNVEKYKLALGNFSTDQAVSKTSLRISPIKINLRACATCDSASYFLNNYSYKGIKYSGYAKSADSVFFFYDGSLKFIKTLYADGGIKEYLEYGDDRRKGNYKSYDRNGKLTIGGFYTSDRKTGNWIQYNYQSYDKVVEDYLNGKEFGIWYYYRGKNVVRCEYYKNGNLDYYYLSDFNNITETRTFYKNGKAYAVATYVDGNLDKYKILSD